MTYVRANFEVDLIDRCGVLLALVGKDGSTVSGANPSLDGPAREGLRSLGIAPATFAPTDADFAGVASTDWGQLCDVAELRALRTVQTAFTKVDQKVSLGSQSLDQIRQGFLARIKELNTLVRDQYGVGLGTVAAGRIDLGFAQTDRTQTDILYPDGGD